MRVRGRRETAPVFIEPDEPLKLRVFIDKSVVKVFVNGKQCVAMRVYPGSEDSTRRVIAFSRPGQPT